MCCGLESQTDVRPPFRGLTVAGCSITASCSNSSTNNHGFYTFVYNLVSYHNLLHPHTDTAQLINGVSTNPRRMYWLMVTGHTHRQLPII